MRLFYWTSDDCDGQVDFEVISFVRRTSDIITLFRSLSLTEHANVLICACIHIKLHS